MLTAKMSTMVTKVAQRYLSQLSQQFHQVALSLKQENFSNFNEEQILRRFIAELLPEDDSRTAVDIGAGDGVKSSNTYALFRSGWKGVGIESDSRKFCRLTQSYRNFPEVWACRCRVTPINVVHLLHAYSIKEDFSVLSLDIDSYDYWVLDALLSSFRPRLIVTEINEKIPPPIRFTVKYDPDFQLTHHFFGYSIASLAVLCERYGYALIALEYNNAFLAPRELPGVQPLDATTAYWEGYLQRADRRTRFRQNHDMEILHSLSAEEGLKFIEQFFARHRGRYELSIENTPGVEKQKAESRKQ